MEAANAERSRERAQAMLDLVTGRTPGANTKRGYDAIVHASVHNVQSKGPGHCSCELPVTQAQANSFGTLHGGAAASLIDTITSAALNTVSNRGSVSTNITTHYLAGVPVGDSAVVDATVLMLGGRMSTTEVRITSKNTGQLCATGVHQKYFSGPEYPLGDVPDWKPPSSKL